MQRQAKLYVVNTDRSWSPGEIWFVVDRSQEPCVVFDLHGARSPIFFCNIQNSFCHAFNQLCHGCNFLCYSNYSLGDIYYFQCCALNFLSVVHESASTQYNFKVILSFLQFPVSQQRYSVSYSQNFFVTLTKPFVTRIIVQMSFLFSYNAVSIC